MKQYDTMLNIISIYSKIQTDNINYFNKNTIKKLNYIKNVSNLNNEIIKIIKKYL